MPERFYEPRASAGGVIVLGGDEARHLQRVRRIGLGARVEVFDGKGFTTAAVVVGLGRDRVELSPTGLPLPDRAVPLSLTLASAVPKGDRFDWLVEKAVELGVGRLVPLLTERSVVVPGGSKLERLRRTVIETSKQCGRNRLMEIGEPVELRTFLHTGPPSDGRRFLAHPGGLAFGCWPALERSSVHVLIGPEGGFTDAEVEEATQANWIAVGLGATVLRVETAALVAASRLLARAEAGLENQES